MKIKTDIAIDLDLTTTIICGALIVLIGVLVLFTIKDVNAFTTCIVTGSGLMAVGKVSNTIYDNAHIDKTNLNNLKQ